MTLEMKEEFNGYKASTLDLNSPEVMKHAYSPAMDAHIAAIKKHRKDKAQSSTDGIVKEFSDHLTMKHKARVSFTPKNISIIKMHNCCTGCGARIYQAWVIDGKKYGKCCKNNISREIKGKKHGK